MDDYPPPYMVGGIVGRPPPPNYRLMRPPPGYRHYYNNDDEPVSDHSRGRYAEDPLLQGERENPYATPPRQLPDSSRNPPVTESEPPRESPTYQKGSSTTNVPTGEKVPNRPGRVKSPYPPYRELDVTGLPSGSLAKDPVAGKIFKIP